MMSQQQPMPPQVQYVMYAPPCYLDAVPPDDGRPADARTTTTTMAPARACRTARTMGATAIIRRRPSARRLMSAIGTRG